MSYTINHYNGTLLATVADGTVDTSTDLTLIGKNYAGYGQSQNDNFVWLLENFANTTQPPNPLQGQIWYDSGNKKLKFWDGSYWRTGNGAEVGTTQPAGLTAGDMYFNTASNQLYIYNGSGLTLVGPQQVTGAGTTQMVSTSLTNSAGTQSFPVIQAVSGGTVVAIISNNTFSIPNTAIPGFDNIVQGITLVDTQASTNGVTTGGYQFHGTASNSLLLNGQPASAFVSATNAQLTTANFSSGFTIGSNSNLLVQVQSGIIANVTAPTFTSTGDIFFQTGSISNTTQPVLRLTGTDALPATSGISSLGSQAYQWLNVYASSFVGTASQANLLNLPGYGYAQANMSSSANTIAGRDGNGNLAANLFQGTATSANYADLAEKYLPDAEYEPGTVVMVGGEKEITACNTIGYALGVISTNPAYMMNSELVGGVYVALRGRVPVKIQGPCAKGDLIYPGPNGLGFSISSTPQMITSSPGNNQFAIALEDNLNSDYNSIKLVECVIL
jgi:hypothetical protein